MWHQKAANTGAFWPFWSNDSSNLDLAENLTAQKTSPAAVR
jgi:hypothetical protein